MSVSLQLAEFCTRTRWQQLSAKCIEKTTHSLLDMIGCMLGASGMDPACRAFADLARKEEARGDATVLGFGFRTSSSRAAMVNGSLTHALDFEDGLDGLPVHPNSSSIPAALAVAETLGSVSGKQFLTALAVGCDLTCRLAAALETNPDDSGWYTPPILSLFGATASACALLELSPEQTVHAWSLALCQGTCSGELKRAPHSSLRAVREGFIARAAVDSAMLAAAGVQGFEQPVEGAGGLYGLYAQGRFSVDRLLHSLGETFYGERLSFKRWPSCRGTHAYMFALQQMRHSNEFHADEVTGMEAEVGPIPRMLMEPRADKLSPGNAITAKFSIPYTLAVMLRKGDVVLDDFSANALADPATLMLTPRVSMKFSPSLGPTQGILNIRLKDGIEFSREVNFPPGSPENPLSESDLVAKFVDCAAHADRPWRTTDALRAAETILRVAEMQDICQELVQPLFAL